jgi:hypothetical protein
MYLNQRTTLKPRPEELDPNPTQIVPCGYYGGGVWTAHPIGLFIVAALIAIGIWGMPEARWFFAGAIPLGGLCGFLLQRGHHRPLTEDVRIIPAAY